LTVLVYNVSIYLVFTLKFSNILNGRQRSR